jgi:hypothetical protein
MTDNSSNENSSEQTQQLPTIEEAGQQMPRRKSFTAPPDPPAQKSHAGLIVTVIILVLLLGGGVSAWFFVPGVQDKVKSSNVMQWLDNSIKGTKAEPTPAPQAPKQPEVNVKDLLLEAENLHTKWVATGEGLDEMVGKYRAILKADPGNSVAQWFLTRTKSILREEAANYFKIGDTKTACDFVNKTLFVDPQDPEALKLKANCTSP